MKTILLLLNKVYKVITSQIELLKDNMVKTNDEELCKLLKNSNDNLEFQKAVNFIENNPYETKQIILNDTIVTIQKLN